MHLADKFTLIASFATTRISSIVDAMPYREWSPIHRAKKREYQGGDEIFSPRDKRQLRRQRRVDANLLRVGLRNYNLDPPAKGLFPTTTPIAPSAFALLSGASANWQVVAGITPPVTPSR